MKGIQFNSLNERVLGVDMRLENFFILIGIVVATLIFMAIPPLFVLSLFFKWYVLISLVLALIVFAEILFIVGYVYSEISLTN